MWKLDAIIQDEAFLIPFWNAPYERILYWDKLCWPRIFCQAHADAVHRLAGLLGRSGQEKALHEAMAAASP